MLQIEPNNYEILANRKYGDRKFAKDLPINTHYSGVLSEPLKGEYVEEDYQADYYNDEYNYVDNSRYVLD